MLRHEAEQLIACTRRTARESIRSFAVTQGQPAFGERHTAIVSSRVDSRATRRGESFSIRRGRPLTSKSSYLAFAKPFIRVLVLICPTLETFFAARPWLGPWRGLPALKLLSGLSRHRQDSLRRTFAPSAGQLVSARPENGCLHLFPSESFKNQYLAPNLHGPCLAWPEAVGCACDALRPATGSAARREAPATLPSPRLRPGLGLLCRHYSQDASCPPERHSRPPPSGGGPLGDFLADRRSTPFHLSRNPLGIWLIPSEGQLPSWGTSRYGHHVSYSTRRSEGILALRPG